MEMATMDIRRAINSVNSISEMARRMNIALWEGEWAGFLKGMPCLRQG
jgi:hypothetical protein